MNKLLASVTMLLVLLAALAIFSVKRVSTEIIIESTPEKIWSVLMDESGYQHWNPVLLPLEGDISQGATIRYQWTQANGGSVEIDSRVMSLVENVELHQRGGTPGVLTFDHRYTLTPSKGGTLVQQTEVYRGIGVLFWDANQMEPAYQKVNEALKERVRTMRDEPGSQNVGAL